MIVVSDSGPLMALAKVNGLHILFRLFARIQAAVGLIKILRQRRDIWISDELCDHALDLLKDS